MTRPLANRDHDITSIDKFYLATIFELSILKKMFEAFDKKYSTTNIACFYQLFNNYQAISTKKIL